MSPMTYACPCFATDRCAETTSDPTSMLEHARAAHNLTMFGIGDLPDPIFVSQFEARHGEEAVRVISCRRCARDMHRVEGVWRHTADDSLACLDPESMKPYPNNPKENSTMSATTATKLRASKPGSEVQRKWFFTLTAEQKAEVRERVAALAFTEGLSMAEAWTTVYSYPAVARPEMAVPETKPVNERVARLNAAKAERRAVKEAEAAGQPRPATPVLDSLEGEQLSSRPKAAPAVKAETKRAVARAEGKALRWFVDGKPVNPPHDRLAGVSRATGRKGGERLSTDALRALLVANGIAEPDSSAWSFTLPNGVVLSTELPA